MTKKESILSNSNLYIIFGVTLMAVMGVTSIAPAFPEIIKYFNITDHQVGWLIVAFTLPGVFLTPVVGVLADRLGRKLILVPSLFLFAVSGLACAFIPDFHLLLVARFLQGVGASSLASLNITLIGDLFTGDKRVAAMGYNASVLSIGTASYPAIGGLMATLGWQYIFFLPILAIPLAIWVMYGLKDPELGSKQSLKTYFLNVWKAINRKTVWALFLSNILVFVVLYGAYLTYLPLLMGNSFHSGSLKIGATMSIMSLVTAVVASQLPRIHRLLGSRKQLLVAIVFYFLSMMVLGFSEQWSFVVFAVILFGLGHGVIIPSIQNMLVSLASMQERAAFMSLNSMVLRIGQTVGPLLIGIFYALGGISYSFFAGAGTAVVMFLIITIMVKENH